MPNENSKFNFVSAERPRARAFLPSEPRAIPFDEAQSLIVTIVHEANGIPISGYEIVRRSNGALNVNSIYVQIDRLVNLGVLRSEYEQLPSGAKPKLPKRLITLGEGGSILFTHEKESAYGQHTPQSRKPVFSDLPRTGDSVPNPL